MPIVVPTTTKLDLGRVEAGGIERGVDRGDRVVRIGGHLRDMPASGLLVDRDEIRERSAGVDPDRDAHPGRSYPSVLSDRRGRWRGESI